MSSNVMDHPSQDFFNLLNPLHVFESRGSATSPASGDHRAFA